MHSEKDTLHFECILSNVKMSNFNNHSAYMFFCPSQCRVVQFSQVFTYVANLT